VTAAWEYRRATWDEVCELGPAGWRLVPVPPIVEMKQVFGQVQAGEPMYAMEREAMAAGGGPGRQVVSSSLVSATGPLGSGRD
jgi:hypothetical protein